MILSGLSLQNFRNFKKKTFQFSPKVTIIVGPNTFGKTNILEAIYMLATGKSFRAELEREVILYDEEIGRVQGTIEQSNNRTIKQLEIIITTGQVGGKKVPKKKFLVNGVSKRSTDFIGNFFAVLFSPQDLQLITDSPSLRRKYLNTVLSCVDKEYRRALLVYEKGLRQRNRILERTRERRANLSQLEYWDKLLITNGRIVTEKREELIEFINSKPGFLEKDNGEFRMVYEKNEISEKRLKEKQEKEILLGVTLVGPHRDDFVIKLKSKSSKVKATIQSSKLEELGNISTYGSRSGLRQSRDLSVYGSRGEQRLAVLWLKLGELAFLEEKTSQKPVLLLDDIFSELDQNHRDLVTKIIPNQQTIITTTEEEVVKGKFLKEAKIIKLEI